MKKPSRSKQPDLTIVIPAYCEELRIGRTLDELGTFLKTDAFFRNKDVEVLVPVADCPDRTQSIVRNKEQQFTNLSLVELGPTKGKGYAVQTGVLKSSGTCVLFMDADLATPLRHMEQFYKVCEQGNDVVIGTRNLATYRPSPVRRLASITGNLLFRVVSGLLIEDSQCGFKMFRRDAGKLCFSKMTIPTWGFDMEILTIARVNGLSVRHVRIDDWKDVPYSTFTDHVVRVSLHSIADLSIILKNKHLGKYRAAETSAFPDAATAEQFETSP